MLPIKGHCSYLGETGYNYHSRNFFRSLAKIYPDLKIRNFTVCDKKDRYIDELDKQILSEQTLFTGESRKEYPILDNTEILDRDLSGQKINIILNPVSHFYFFDIYNGPKIAYVVWETTLFPKDFFKKLLEFDQLWVPSRWQRDNAIRQGYPEDRIFIVPEGLDEDLFKFNDDEKPDNSFNFLLCGRWEYRKSTKEIIETFLSTFDKNDPVNLILNVDNQFSKISTLEQLKQNGFEDRRLIIKSFLSRIDYIKLLRTAQVLITCSRGEGWNRPLHEALAIGTPAIYSDYGPQLEFAMGSPLKVNILKECLADSFDSKDLSGNWCEPDFKHLGTMMRDVYKNYQFYKNDAINRSKQIQDNFRSNEIALSVKTILDQTLLQNNDIIFITGGDKGYFPLIEKLVKSVELFSQYKIVVYGVNEQPQFNSSHCINKQINLIQTKDSDKWYFKQHICLKALKDFYNHTRFVWIDGDSIVNNNIDNVSNYFNDLENYPIPDVHHLKEYYFFDINDRGERYNETVYNELLMKEFNIKRNSDILSHASFFIFNRKCNWFFKEIVDIYENLKVRGNDKIIICNDEGIDNLLRWKYNFKKLLPQSNFETEFNFEYINDFFTRNGPYDFGNSGGWTFIPEDKEKIIYFHGNKIPEKADRIIELIQQQTSNCSIPFNSNDHLFVVCCHPNTKEGENLTLECINRIKLLETEVLLSSHYPITTELSNAADYCIYDKNNKLIFEKEYEDLGLFNAIFFENNDLRMDFIKPIIHDYAVFILIRNAFIFARQKNKKFLHIINYDCLIDIELYIKNFINPLINSSDLCYTNWDVLNKEAMICYLFSLRISSFEHLFDFVDHLENYLNNSYRSTNWQLDILFFQFVSKNKLNKFWADYPLNDLNMLSIDGNSNLFELIYPSIDEYHNLYLFIKNYSKQEYDIRIHYNNYDKEHNVNKGIYFTEIIGQAVSQQLIEVFNEEKRIFTFKIPDDLNEFYRTNKCVLKPVNHKPIIPNHSNINDHIFIICGHSNTESKKETLLNCINSIKKTGIQSILCSHFQELPEIYSRVDYFLYDNYDPVIKHDQYDQFQMTNSVFYGNDDLRIDWINPFSHDYSVFRLMQNGFRLARSLDKKFVHIIEYDCVVNQEQFEKELILPLNTYDISHSIWDRNIKDLIATYLFSFRINSLEKLFESIHSTEEYYRNRIKGWNLEKLFFDFCQNNNLKIYLNNYPSDLMNLNSIFKQHNIFEECRLCSDDNQNLYIHIRTRDICNIRIEYQGFKKQLQLDSENTIKIGTYVEGGKVAIYLNDQIMFEKQLMGSYERFYKLNKLSHKKQNTLINTYIDESFKLGTSQNRQEIEQFSHFLSNHKIKNFLEIGTDLGGSFLLFGKLSDPDGIKISIDLPYDQSEPRKQWIFNRNKTINDNLQNVHLLELDSHKQESIIKIKEILNGELLDLLFIDGDHSINGIKQDFELYSPFVRKGGIIAFHDVIYPKIYKGDLINAWEFWNSLSGDKLEFKSNNQYGGIGVIFNNDKLQCNNIVVETPATINCHFIQGSFCEVLSNNPSQYVVNFIDSRNNQLKSRIEINNNNYAKCFHAYFIPYRVQVSNINEGGLIFDYLLNLTNHRVYIHLDSKSLGDTIAWFPYVEKFRLKHNCQVICSTFWNNLFRNEYPNIEFVNPGSVINDIFAMYEVGVFHDEFKEPHDYRKIPLQQISSNILGLEHKEVRPRIYTGKKNSTKNKIIGISTHSTAQAKFWNYPGGWQEIINHLKNKGFEVVLLQLEDCNLKGIIKPDCNNIKSTIEWLNKCQFYIGVSSGVSWLAWALNIPVVMISGFTKPFNEFECIRISPPEGICNGCWHEELWDDKAKGDWNWCPKHKGTERQFECSKTITPEQVIQVLKTNNLIE